MLSIRSDERGKVEALDLGADDYVAKPVRHGRAGSRACAPRCATGCSRKASEPIFRSGDLAVDLVRRHVTVKGQEVKLSPQEYDLLRLLVMHAGKVLTHTHIMREVWGAATDVQYLRIYVRQLRHKIEARPRAPIADPHRERRGVSVEGGRVSESQPTSSLRGGLRPTKQSRASREASGLLRFARDDVERSCTLQAII